MQNEIHQNSLIKFIVQILDSNGAVDISEASTKKLIFQKPDKSVANFNATFSTDGTDGTIFYMTEINDFDQTGLYRYQVYLLFSGGSTVYSDIGDFRVYPNLELF